MQSLQVTQQGFESGQAGFIALIDAQRLLLEFQLAHQQALADRGKRLAEVETFVNRDLLDPRRTADATGDPTPDAAGKIGRKPR